MPISNVKQRLHLIDESTWGTFPGSPTRVHIPFTSYGIQLRNERRRALPQVGLRQAKHGRTFRSTVSGPLSMPLYAWRPAGLSMSLAQHVLAWGFADSGGTVHEAIDLPSKSAEFAEGPDLANKRHLGLRVNTATLAGDGNAGTLLLNLDLVGKDEASFASAAAIPTNVYETTEFSYEDSVFEIDLGAGYVAIDLSNFQIAVANNLISDFVGGRRISVLAAGRRNSTLQISFPKEDDTWDALRRTITDAGPEPGYKFKVTLKGLHKGTGTADTTWTEIVIELPLIKYAGHDDNRAIEDIARLAPLNFDVLKPDSTSNDINLTASDIE